MKNRTIMASVLVAVAILAIWWLFLFSPARGDASKVDKDIDAAKTESRTLQTQVKQLEDLERHAPEIKSNLDRLHKAVPQTPDLASFIEEANKVATDAGVKWASVTPSQPTDALSAGTTQLAISVTGGYYQVLDYLNRMDNLSRLVVVDQVSLSGSTSADAPEPELTASFTARMFNQAAPVATATPNGSTTPTSVAGGGGVAATPQPQNS
jgi:type IV pilus assembly protein PilO